MKNTLPEFFIALITILLIVGCEDQKEIPESNISGKVTNSSGCKSLKSGNLKFDIADTLSCVHYIFDTGSHKLTINHINAGFNCCPFDLSCQVSVINDTIMIRETEKEQGCNCLCLFDLDIELKDVDPKKYQVRFIEPYAEGQAPLMFEMDLSAQNEDEICVIRKMYPWGG